MVTPTFTQIAAENDTQVASIILPDSMTELTVQLINTIPPIWEGDISNFGQQSSAVYQRYVDVVVGTSSVNTYLLSSVGLGAFWGRTPGKSCGFHDCDRGYVTNLFSPVGDPAQPTAYPQLNPATTDSLTLYGLPAFAELRMRTVLVAATAGGAAYGNGTAAAQNGGSLNIVDNRYASEVQVRNRPAWRIDYRATGKPGALPAGSNRCAARSISYGEPPTPATPQCMVSLPAGNVGDVFARDELQNDRVVCNYEYVCAVNYTVPGSPAAWSTRRERQFITPIDTR